jgi:16S rRNA A1518/A1519 N6-dimethyltransferase RsmA/KsgA/DIM1 with predicted DNA glycosylase/AP lyase activity
MDSYSNLGYSYEYDPQYDIGTNEAQLFLAGSLMFQLDEKCVANSPYGMVSHLILKQFYKLKNKNSILILNQNNTLYNK